MLSLAKGEHAVALHNMQEEPGAEDGIGADRGGDGHGSLRETQRSSRVMLRFLVKYYRA